MNKQNKIYWLASYPKSGNTWFRIFLLYYFNNKYADINDMSFLGGIASSRKKVKKYNQNYKRYFDNEEKNKLRHDAYIKYQQTITKNEYHKIHDAYRYIDNKPIIPTEISGGIIYFIRNPFDIVISFANHMDVDYDTSIKNINDNDFKIGGANKQLKQNLFSWSNHVRSWTEQKNIPVIVIRYEDMLENTFEIFSKAIKFLNIDYNKNKIIETINLTKFERLQQIELDIGFKEKSKKSERFFNIGKSNYGYNLLSDNQRKSIINNHFDIMKKYNYII